MLFGLPVGSIRGRIVAQSPSNSGLKMRKQGLDTEFDIEDGVRIRAEPAHGSIEAMAWVHAGIRPTAVFIPIGWGERQPYNPWRPVNFLTDSTQRDPVSDQTNLKVLLCRVSRAAG